MYPYTEMNGNLLYKLWGKTNERDKEKKEDWCWRMHPAICHMVDVGYVAEAWLLADPGLLDRFALLATDIDRDALRHIIVTIVALHDLGKLHRSFQSKSEEGWKAGYANADKTRASNNGRGFDHGLGTAKIMAELAGQDRNFYQWYNWLPVINAAAAHHGRLYAEELQTNDIEVYPSLKFEKEYAVEAVYILAEIFEAPADLPEPPEANRFAMLLAGFCSVTDWFGSNSDVYTFAPDVASAEDLRTYLKTLRRSCKAESQLREAGIISETTTVPPSYSDLFEFIKSEESLHPLQREALKVSFGKTPGSEIIAVEAPMGSGKTELALYLAGQAIGHQHANGIYFALPTQASSNALLDRIENFARKITAEGKEISLALAHGGRKFNEDYQRLQESYHRSRRSGSAYDDEKIEPSEVTIPSWLQSSKRTLLAAIGVGTIDQTMLGAMIAKHSFVRLFALANKVVIFDEIHAYDSYMNVLIGRLLEWLGALGTKVILLSATLPKRLRHDLLKSYGIAPAALVQTSDGSYDPYPLMIEGKGSKISSFVPSSDEDDSRKKVIRLRQIPASEQSRTQAGSEEAFRLAQMGGCVAWIRNTVREAQEAWNLLQTMAATCPESERPQIVTLHARFIRNDRNAIERELVKALGKKGGKEDGIKRPERIIVVATQVIEQSVDLDFDAMISDLAPADLLLQRTGRLWRHHRSRQERHAHTDPVFYVLTPTEDELRSLAFGASEYVYDAETLLRSARLVQQTETWKMPEACRSVVADLYDRDAQYWTAEQLDADPTPLEQARKRMYNVKERLEGTARRLLVCKPGNTPLEGKSAFTLNDDADANIPISTRYGGRSLTAVILKREGNTFHLLGKPECSLTDLPRPDNYRGEIALEEGVELSSVSFPWYSGAPVETALPSELTPFIEWWRDKRPHDHRFFALLNEREEFDTPLLIGRYRTKNGKAIEGLVIEKKKEQDRDPLIEYENL